ncbi:MAG: DUF177 domain-containing protein [Saprospiraceae bacterium]|nr:DUF177 domain-containing protein [Saprospiraceae bacterium]MBK8632049.1 DUF177 domain-containing protein [Saprospiraceae bacterium]MBP7642984.1 DUF177 domain-containing protein [Saprospiraceae bacterium]
MNVLDHFSVPYLGLKNGIHQINFEVDDSFFLTFENSYVEGGKLKVEMSLDKRSDLAVADFIFDGNVRVTCDRCLQSFDHPIEGDSKLHIKIGLQDPDQDEVLFIDQETSSINFASYIYECICLLLPMSITHEDIDDCDPEMIAKLNKTNDDATKNDIWNSLKGLDLE